MESTFVDWLANVGSSAFSYSLAAFVLLNGAAIAAVAITRDRSIVNRWTARLLAANLVLVGTGVGIPVLTAVARLGVIALSPAVQVALPASEAEQDEALEASRARQLRGR